MLGWPTAVLGGLLVAASIHHGVNRGGGEAIGGGLLGAGLLGLGGWLIYGSTPVSQDGSGVQWYLDEPISTTPQVIQSALSTD